MTFHLKQICPTGIRMNSYFQSKKKLLKHAPETELIRTKDFAQKREEKKVRGLSCLDTQVTRD